MKTSSLQRAAGSLLVALSVITFASPAMAWECHKDISGGDDIGPATLVGASAPGHTDSRYNAEVTKAKLQIGDRSNTCFSDNRIDELESFNNHFYLSKNGITIFFREIGDSFRSELREEREFQVGDAGNDYLKTRARVYNKIDGLTKLTIAQVHAENSSGPVARLAWYAAGEINDVDGNSPEGIWLSLRQGPSCSGSTCFSHSFIGDYESQFKLYRLGIWGSRLRLKVGNTYQDIIREDIFDEDNDGDYAEKVVSDSIQLKDSDWDGKDLYLKLGTYVNSDGGARVAHRGVRFY